MSDMVTTVLLSELTENAKKIGNSDRPLFTAERFIIAIINKLDESFENTITTELMDLGAELSKASFNNKEVKNRLIEYVNSSANNYLVDTLYMRAAQGRAQQSAKESKMERLNSVLLLRSIIEKPSDPIKEAFAASKQKSSSDTKSGAAGNDFFSMLEQNITALIKKDKEPNGSDTSSASTEGIPIPGAAIAQKTTATPVSEEKHDTESGAKHEVAALVSDVKRIRKELQELVYGQDNAINIFSTGYFQACVRSMTDKTATRPRATFLFAGPPGVGKTFLAENAADSLKLPFMRFDMSEYADGNAHLEFCGTDKSYKNPKEGNVTGFVLKNPKSVLLFDEIEKADISVIHLFLQMLDAGRLRDNFHAQEVSFTDTIIILTTNAGKQLYEDSESGDFSSVSRKVIVKALQSDKNPETGVPYFPAAICSRFASGNVVMFNHIGAHNLHGIAKKEIKRFVDNFESETGIKISIDERVYTALLFAEGSTADARTIRSRADSFINDEVYELLRLIDSTKVKTGVANVESIDITLDLSHASENICGFFNSAEKPKILIFGDNETVDEVKARLSYFEAFGAKTRDEAVNIIKTCNIDFAMVDIKHDAPADFEGILNAEDIESPGRELLKFIREQRLSFPVYLIEKSPESLTDEEVVSFKSQGIRDVLYMSEDAKLFEERMNTVAVSLHQQAGMVKLARQNKLISFGTAQSISSDGKNAKIKLFDFEMVTAIDSEDSKNILNAVSTPDLSFEDVIGAADAKKELAYFVEYLKNPAKYIGTGLKAPKGILLYGPPGTGKTMLAKAMASESGVTFIAAEGNQFLKKYMGEGSEKVHELFNVARKYAPSVLFIDEIDAIAKERKGGEGSHGSEDTLTSFLTEMDGFNNDPSKPVFVLAATNFDIEPGRQKSLDPALMRRFDRRIYIDLPKKEDRIRFLKFKFEKNKAFDISEEQLENIAVRSTGMSLADLDSVLELALRSAVRDKSTNVNNEILEEAFETFNSGDVKKWDESTLERVAKHESGHAFLCWESGEIPSYLTIVARGDHGGYMQHDDKEDKAIYTKDELLWNIRTSLGGRAAEIVYYGERNGISTGASGDLASATRLAEHIVCRYGMDDDFGLAVVNDISNSALSGDVRRIVNRILDEQLKEAVRIISENKNKVDRLVKELMEKNHLKGNEIDAILSKQI